MVTMITDRICIGDSSDGSQPPPLVDAALNVALEVDTLPRSGDLHRHKVGLVNGAGNDDHLLISAVSLLYSLNKNHRRVLVYCEVGGLRSVLIVASYVSIAKNMEFSKVVNDIMKIRNIENYSPILYKQFESLLPIIKTVLTSNTRPQ